MELNEIIDKFDDLVERYNSDFRIFPVTFESRDALHQYNNEFSFLYKEIRPHGAHFLGMKTTRDNEAARAYKARVARKIQEEDSTGKLSWSKACDLALASDDYEKWLDERKEYYENWDSVSHLRNSIHTYMINIGLKLKNL